MNNTCHRLCSGTFLVLLLRAKRTKAKKDIRKFSTNDTTNPEFPKGLITIFDSGYYELYESSLKTNTLHYKNVKFPKLIICHLITSNNSFPASIVSKKLLPWKNL